MNGPAAETPTKLADRPTNSFGAFMASVPPQKKIFLSQELTLSGFPEKPGEQN